MLHLGKGVLQPPQLSFPPNHQRQEPVLHDGSQPQQPIRRDRLPLALQLQGVHRLQLDGPTDQPDRLLAQQHLTRCRCLLEARRHIDRIAGGQPLSGPGHHLPAGDSDPGLQSQLRDCRLHLACRPHRPEGIVLVELRHPEHRHHRIPNELLHRTPV
jgi:hypothetical protein